MWTNQTCTLTSKDYAILETIHDRSHMLADPARQILTHKLDTATVVFCEDIDANIVTLNTRLRYRIGASRPQTAIITQSPMDGMVGQCLSLQTARGLACLGLAEAAAMALPGVDGSPPERLVVEAILFQPEAARRDRLKQELSRPSLRLVHSAHLDIDPPPDRL
ncbi:MAG: nucleoside-diphosphate kinase [Hoeflea sp.]|uniref:nucleoside-diphosphate kinase n=1 Tax=Hoeflea sp. TaxID=1940281 RepID=UPI00272F223C|nr:nucleoside-diphosphate kinase [Hoeflea sp.]MDP2121624.1 nucleoside-diphosphate kinase [Hoeflea sp.]MDZ7601244.1 nucleoside-diphosphate kinase [Hoeflea sp.]